MAPRVAPVACKGQKFCYDTVLGFNFDGIHAKEVWVCFHKIGAMGAMQLYTFRDDRVHCDLARPWVFRSSTDIFKPLFGLVAAERDVKQLKHNIEWMPETHVRADLCDACVMPIEHTKSESKSHLSDALDVWDEAGPDELDTEADVTLHVGQDLPRYAHERN